SSSFFLVTRFLPPDKRAKVEMIYAAVRYPDEIVDTFSLSPERKRHLLREWERSYDRALSGATVDDSLSAGIPWILANFGQIVMRHAIPPEHYRAFLDAMRRDIEPTPYTNLDNLVSDYIYGSAIVVGYFLAHVYTPSAGSTLAETYDASANLAIALQL